MAVSFRLSWQPVNSLGVNLNEISYSLSVFKELLIPCNRISGHWD
jgi:hypothetical protein